MSDNSVYANSTSVSSSQSKNKQSIEDFSTVSDIENIWLLPDGVNDLLSEEAHKQEWLRYELTKLLVSWGYQLICPPMIEFTESLLGNASEDLKRQTFKIIDQLSGRLMGVRADITPQILRIDAHLNKLSKGNSIARYCYAGHVIRTLPNGLFGSRTPLQLGAEIFGCNSIDAELELIDVLFELIDKLELKSKLHIDIGHVGIFERLKQLAKLSDDEVAVLSNLYANKALPELKAVCIDLPMGEDFYQLAVYGHDVDALQDTLSTPAKTDAKIKECINEVKRLVAHINKAHQGNVSVDITGLGYHYHTGIIFNGYFDKESLPVVRGGRFNGRPVANMRLTDDTSSERSATGFSLEVTRLQRHISLQSSKQILINYDDLCNLKLHLKDTDGLVANDNKASLNQQLILQLNDKVDELKSAGNSVIKPLNQYDLPKEVTHVLLLKDNEWVVQKAK